jgi:uncharacterized membrane protein YgcG
MLERYTLVDHFTAATAASATPSWWRMDSVVLLWILGTLTVDLQATIRERGVTTRQAWLAIEDQFLGNCEARIMYLDTQFCNFMHGDLSNDHYCRRMKTMYDDLHDIGMHIDDCTLVLNLLRRLNKKFDSLKTILQRTNSFSSFCEARNDLLLEELTLDAEATFGSTIAFTSSSGPQQRNQSSPTTFSAPRPPPSSDGDGGGGGGHGGGRGHGRGGGGGGTSTPSTGQVKGSSPWPSLYNPWTDTIRVWLGLSTGGALYRPPQLQHTLFAAPPPVQQTGAPTTPLAPPLLPRVPPHQSLFSALANT